jgi:hypothetical protein
VSESHPSREALVAQYEDLTAKYEEALRLRGSLLEEEAQLDLAITAGYRTQDEIIRSLHAAPSSPPKQPE